MIVKSCPHCGGDLPGPRNPLPTVDVIVHEPGRGILLIERRNPPPGWALPGGFVDYGESCEDAAVREALEETGLRVTLTGLVGVFSRPDRDPRFHTLSVVYAARAENPDELKAGDDAAKAAFFSLDDLPELAFDHDEIIGRYLAGSVCPASGKEPPTPL